ncbi:MAG: polysaccharide deacetylase family protein [Clostridia bacterium]|nr:polysaccharide deacetylase family protein [Clostridia bacterium]
MKRFVSASLAVVFSASLLLSGCGRNEQGSNQVTVSPSSNVVVEQNTPIPSAPKPTPDLAKVKPNEAGKIMVVMFHNFVESFTPSKYDNGEYTTTFDDFRKLLPELYEKGYRLISVSDYLNNNISVEAGYKPMIFTFDDGTSGQFNLAEENGTLTANKQSAVGIMEEFIKTHPDFGLKGTFYVNLGLNTFEGKGTLDQRLKYLVDKGFDIGNHTMTHIALSQVKTADVIQKEIGGNQKKILELIPDYKMVSLALPFGQATKSLRGYVEKGEFEGVKYQNFAIMEVGANPTYSPISKKFNPLSTARVRATGMKPVECDLAWWIKNLSEKEQFISDGDPNRVTIPKEKEADISKERISGKELILY